MAIRARRSSAVALLCTSLFACDGGTVAVAKPAAPAKAESKPKAKQGQNTMGWIEVARLGEFLPETRVDESVKLLKTRDLESRAEPTLNAMAATSADGPGLDKAIAALKAALPSFNDPKYEGSGDPPDVGAMKQAALVTLHGLLARAGHAVAKQSHSEAAAAALVKAQRTIAGYRPALLDELKDELEGALGAELFERATETLDKK